MRIWIGCLLAAAMAGCAASSQSHSAREGAFYREWAVAIGHLGVDAYSVREFAAANEALEEKVRGLKRDVLDQIECFLVPRSEGYRLVLVSNRPLSLVEEEQVRVFADQSLATAMEKASRAKEANQSLEPTTMLGTSAAEQPLVPSIVVAHL